MTREHPDWCEGDVDADFEGTTHLSRSQSWRPSYQHEVAIAEVLHQVVYPDGDAETPAAMVRIDNAANPGEVAMAAEDVTVFVDHLSSLRAALAAEPEDPPPVVGPPPPA